MLRHSSKFATFARGFVAIAALAIVATQYAVAGDDADTTSAYLAQSLKQPSVTIADTTIRTEALREVYSANGNQLLWVDSSGLTRRARKALDVITAASEQGLDANLFAARTIRTLHSMPRGTAEQATARRVGLDMLMSNAVLRYATTMNRGTVRPQANTGIAALSTAEQAAMLTAAAATRDTAGYLASLTPQAAPYATMKTMLADYQTIAKNGGWPEFTVGKPIKPGMSDARVASLREMLTITGDMKKTSTDSLTYDEAIVEGVKQFQQRHGIEADGVLGASTQAALAVPVSKRIEQIAMTMERMRWMPRDLGDRYVLVNIPSYQLTAVAGGKQMEMNVVVGKTASPTPMFSKAITDVVFNPSWGVPAKIAVNEMLPKIRKNPGYLASAGFTVVSNGEAVDPTAVDWESVGHGNFNYAIRQNPGSGNALGKVKFTIPDSDNIYLHDTSNRGVFTRSDRDLSHGCVRLGDPRAFTQFLLQSEGWSEAKIDASYDSATSKTVKITPMPVHLVYWTSWVDSSGRPHFTRDIYGKDKALLAAMATPQPRSSDSVKLAMN
ncbi:MAG: L,D-transpeptidase family protein [Pseudomonadota bacterium]